MLIQLAGHDGVIVALEFQSIVQGGHFMVLAAFVFVDDAGGGFTVFAIYAGFSLSYADFSARTVFAGKADFTIFAVFAVFSGFTEIDLIVQGEIIGQLPVGVCFLDFQIAVGAVFLSVDHDFSRFAVSVDGFRQVGDIGRVLICLVIHDFQLRYIHRVIGIRAARDIGNAAVVLRDCFVAKSICFIADRYDAVFFLEGFLG